MSRCSDFASILRAKGKIENGVCVATIDSKINASILGIRTKSPVAMEISFSYENVDANGRALCLGEILLLQSQVNTFISAIRRGRIKVTAVHNHWLFDNPKLMYVHIEAKMPPLTFARRVRRALNMVQM